MKIRVLHVIGSLEVGGAETALVRTCLATQVWGLEHQVLLLGSTGPLEGQLKEAGVHVLAPRSRFPDLAQLFRLTAEWHPHIIQGWMYHGNLAALLLATVWFPGASLAWNIRCGLDTPHRFRRSTRALIRLLARLSQGPEAILYNAASARSGHEELGYRREHAEVIPNGFDLHSFRPNAVFRKELRSELSLPPEVKLIGLVARFHAEKNPGLFLQALARLPADIHGLMAGPGMTQENLELTELISDLGLSARIHLLGLRGDMPRVMAGLDVAVSASWNEGFSNALGEAQACGIPCVATDVGDSALLLGELGRLVPPGAVEAMTQALSGLLGMSPEEREKLGRQCRQRMEDSYGLPFVAKRYSNLYHHLAGRL